MTLKPATNLIEAFRLCDPSRPVDGDDPRSRYVDLSPGRGYDGDVAEQCRRRIARSPEPLVQFIAGQRGCGKSTELRRLQSLLYEEGYAVAHLDLAADLDVEDIEPVDLMVAVLRNLEASLRRNRMAIDEGLLADSALWLGKAVLGVSRSRQITSALRADVGDEQAPLLARLLARLGAQIGSGGHVKQHLRWRLDPLVPQLQERARLPADAGRRAAHQQGKKDLVILLDHLDRLALREIGPGRTSHEVLFLERGDLFRGLGCHLVVAAPITLLFSPRMTELRSKFPHHHLLPAVKLTERSSHDRWLPGRELLRELLERRFDAGAVLAGGVDEILIAASGGHPQVLLTLTSYALDFVDEPPVPLGAARKAFRRLVTDFERSIPEAHFAELARVYKRQRVKPEPVYLRLLHDREILPYQYDQSWYEVHPAIMELLQFQEACEGVRKGIRR